MRYHLLEVTSEYPGPKVVETHDDWDDVIDTYGVDGLFPLGEPSPAWGAGPGEIQQPAMLAVRLNKSHGYETMGIIVPETAVIRSLDEDD